MHFGKHLPFVEDDFRMISEFGFNFVRLPIDYRGYIAEGNWARFDEKPLAQIDQAIEWGVYQFENTHMTKRLPD